MKYFKELTVDESKLNIIKESTLSYIKRIYDEELRSLPLSTSMIKFEEFCNCVPEILTLLDDYGIKPVAIVLIVARSDDHVKLHADYIDAKRPQCRINIPILNCDNNYTEFYSGGVYNTEILPNGYSAIFVTEDSEHPLKLEDSISITKPTVFRIQYPHRVSIKNPNIPRITLSLVMDKDPVFLLDDE